MSEQTKPVIGDETHAEALRIAERHHAKMGWKFTPVQIAQTAQEMIAVLRAAQQATSVDCLRIIAEHAGTLRLMNEQYAANALLKVHKEIEALTAKNTSGGSNA